MEQRISRGRFHTGRRDLLTRRPGKGKGKRDPLVNGCDVQLQYSSWEIPAGREEEGECRRRFGFFCDEGLCLSGCHSAPASQQRGPLPSASIVYFISHATPWQIPPPNPKYWDARSCFIPTTRTLPAQNKPRRGNFAACSSYSKCSFHVHVRMCRTESLNGYSYNSVLSCVLCKPSCKITLHYP